MKRKIFSTLCCGLIALTLAACAKTEQPATSNSSNGASTSQSNEAQTKTPPADVVRATVNEVEIVAGNASEASVQLNIANGYHINGNPPTFSYLKATELQVEAAPGITVGQPVYPPAIKKKFAFAQDQPLAVYEGEVSIKLPLRADSKAAKGERKLDASLRIQACDDQACYPPRTVKLNIPLKVQ
jgi:hypothetical protein